MHNGEYIYEKIKSSGISLTAVCKELGISRSTLYTWLKDKDLPVDRIYKIANAIKADVSEEFPGFVHFSELVPVRDKYKDVELADLKKRYVDLLEKYSALQERNLELEKQLLTASS